MLASICEIRTPIIPKYSPIHMHGQRVKNSRSRTTVESKYTRSVRVDVCMADFVVRIECIIKYSSRVMILKHISKRIADCMSFTYKYTSIHQQNTHTHCTRTTYDQTSTFLSFLRSCWCTCGATYVFAIRMTFYFYWLSLHTVSFVQPS